VPGPTEALEPATEAFAPLSEPWNEGVMCFAPQMIGAFRGVYGNTLPAFATDNGMTFASLQQPLVGRGAFKIAENESPQPQDRVFLTYNFYSHLPVFAASGLTFQPGILPIDVPAGNIRVKSLDVHQQTFGFEKTIGCNFSIGMRLPFFQTAGGDVDFEIPTGAAPLLGGGVIGNDDCGDLTIITKYALRRDPNGSAFSVGLAITTATGPDFFVVNPNFSLRSQINPTVLPDLFLTQGNSIHSTLLQPYFGLYQACGSLFVHGFTSVVVPTDGRDVTILFNDYGAGWFLYQGGGGLLSSIAPTVEVHVGTPLNGRDPTDLVFMKDQVVFTGGLHLGLGQSTRLTLGTSVPVTGPQPYDLGAVAQFNMRF
jgi:hypothetical protein